MNRKHGIAFFIFCVSLFLGIHNLQSQDLPPRYPMLELFTNTPCPICANQNPGLFSRLANYDGQYHLVSFYPGRPYSSCIFYQANIPENTARWEFYTGEVFGTPTVAINGVDFTNSNGVTNTVLENITGGTSWLEVMVEETTGSSRTVDITLQDHAGGSLTTGQLFAVIVEKEIQYNAPNGETLHHNVFRKFITATGGDEVDLSSGIAMLTYEYEVDAAWQEEQVYVVAWLMDPATGEIINSGTRFDPDHVTSVDPISEAGKLLIYPNPTTDKFAIVLPEIQHKAAVKVFNISGALVFAQDFTASSKISLNAGTWPEGSYLVQVELTDRKLKEWVRVVR